MPLTRQFRFDVVVFVFGAESGDRASPRPAFISFQIAAELRNRAMLRGWGAEVDPWTEQEDWDLATEADLRASSWDALFNLEGKWWTG